MIVKRLIGVAFVLLWITSLGNSRGQDAPPVFHYPEAPRDSTVEDYHGVQVADPYRPLEDPDATATRTWVAAENKITFGFLEAIPQRPAIRARLTALWDYEKYSPPQIESGHYFFTYNTGLQNQGVLFVADAADAHPRGHAGPQQPLP